MSYEEVGVAAREIARGLIALGIRPGDRVSILSGTRPEWTLADLGALCAGAVVAPIYHTNSPEECRYVLDHAGSRVVFCEDAEQAEKVRQVRHLCPALEHVVTFDGSGDDTISLSQLRARAESVDPGAPDAIAARLQPDDPATIIYTSGTTGPPKGCVTTHENCMATAAMYEQQLDFGPGEPVVFMFLPLAHSLARMTQLLVLDVGGTLAYWRGDPKVVLEDLAATRPTHVPSVPRVYEKVHTKALAGVEEAGRLKRSIFHWALATGRHVREVERQGRRPDALLRGRYALADKLVLSKVRDLFGPDIRLGLTGAAPIAQDVLEFFDACGVLILEGYGMTETTAAATLNTKSRFRFGTVGCALPGAELAIAEDGEVQLKGPHVFQGYHNLDDETKESFDGEWFKTGDLATIDDDGFITIAGRTKEIIVTSSGKNITPTNIEEKITNSEVVSQAVVVGDDRPYLVALIEADDGAGEDEVQKAIDEANNDLAKIEQVKKFKILDRELSQDEGELTPTLKLKREKVYENFSDEIDELYDGD
jgi:long-chain acyl-CoA synthetase